MKQCPFCGSNISDVVDSCPVCGRGLRDDSPESLARIWETPVEDTKILEVIQELCQKLGITFAPQRIYWIDKISNGRGPSTLVRTDEPAVLQGSITLAKRARGRLDPEDWRPLIASFLVYTDTLKRRMFSHMFTRIYVPSVLILFVLFYALQFEPNQTRASIPVLAFVAGMVSIFVTWILSLPYIRRMRLESDLAAANVVGKRSLPPRLRQSETPGIR